MVSETRSCRNCKTPFIIEPDDFEFYKKIDVPPPTWCPECRNIRRIAWREERTFYHGTCTLCGKSTISIHAPGGPFTVYCRDCYKSDKWDPQEYGRNYDFNKPFFTQYRELMEAVPRPALTGNNLVNSEFTHACESVKNCFQVFHSFFSENSQNCSALLLSRNCYDSYITDNSDHAYESLHSNRLYRVRFGYFSDECLDSSFLYNCVGCSDCFGSVNLRKQKYCLFNEKLSKQEYLKRIKEWDLGSYNKLAEAKEQFRGLYLSLPRQYAHIINSQNVTGDVIRDAKDCQMCFSALDGVQHCKYLYFGGLNLKDSWDVTAGGDTSELLYEVFGVTGNASRCFFSVGGGNCREIWYCDWNRNSSHLFGCISLKNKKYCILNKQYSREEYGHITAKIKQHMDEVPYMDKKGRVYKFGEFFPTELSAYAYNESWGFSLYPKTKEEVLAEGWKWQESPSRSYQVTLQPDHLPDHIRDADDSIVDEIIGCQHKGTCNEQCTTAFRITREELAFYREMNVALTRLCPNCRNLQRLQWRNGFHLYHRACMCGGVSSLKSAVGSREYKNTSVHAHGSSPCSNEFETTFSSDPLRQSAGEARKLEIVYCDACYKSEFF
jgi:Zn ribbon nucleic-acid-binding protein